MLIAWRRENWITSCLLLLFLIRLVRNLRLIHIHIFTPASGFWRTNSFLSWNDPILKNFSTFQLGFGLLLRESFLGLSWRWLITLGFFKSWNREWLTFVHRSSILSNLVDLGAWFSRKTSFFGSRYLILVFGLANLLATLSQCWRLWSEIWIFSAWI